jgi:hypothetical protein
MLIVSFVPPVNVDSIVYFCASVVCCVNGCWREEGCRKGDEPSLFSYRAGERTVVIFITSGLKGLVGGKRDMEERRQTVVIFIMIDWTYRRYYFHNERLKGACWREEGWRRGDKPSLFL